MIIKKVSDIIKNDIEKDEEFNMIQVILIIVILILSLVKLRSINPKLYRTILKAIYFCGIIIFGIATYIKSKELESVYIATMSFVIASIVLSVIIGFLIKKRVVILVFILLFDFILCMAHPVGYALYQDHYHNYNDNTETIVEYNIIEYKNAFGITLKTEKSI